MSKNLSCTTGLRPNLISKEVYNREIELCKKLTSENGGSCGWGKCKECGVVPLLVKLYEGKLLEKDTEIESRREELIKHE